MARFDSIQSPLFAVETWERKTYGVIRGPVTKAVARNSDGTFRPSTNRSPEVRVPTVRTVDSATL
jgi:hypothetical protein